MGASIVLNLIRATLTGLIVVLLAVLVMQRNSIEERLLNVQVGQEEQADAVKDQARSAKKLQGAIDRLDKRVRALDKAVRAGAIQVRPGGEGADPRPPDLGEDPRTLPHWPTEDNILVGLENEPRAPDDAPEGGTINSWVGSNLTSLNPYVRSDVDQRDRVVAYCMQGLTDISAANPENYIPAIANRVTVSEDKRVFTCYIRKDNLWHTPALSPEERRGSRKWLADLPRQHVTAHDVKFTFDLIREPLSECNSELAYLADLDKVEIIDRYTIRFTWKNASYYNKSSTLGLLVILPRHIFGRDAKGEELPIDEAAQLFQNHWFNLNLCGCGPMQFVEFIDNSHIKLERNDDYWGTKPVIDGITLKIIIDPKIRLSLFKTGELDFLRCEPEQWRSEYLEGNDPGSLKNMEANGKAVLRRELAFGYRYIGWNQKRAMFRDRQLRRALAHAFNKERVIRDVLYGLSVPQDAPVHPKATYYVKDLEQFPFDLKRAAKLLDEAGWKLNDKGVREKVVEGENKELRFKILMPNSRSLYRDFGLVYKKDLATIGVIMDLELREWQKMITLLANKDFDACALGWGLSYDSDQTQIWGPEQADKPRSSNHIAYKSDVIGETLKGLREEFDMAKRRKLHETFQRTIVGDQAYLFLTVNNDAWFINPRLGNHYFNSIRPQLWLLPWFVKAPQ